MSANHFSGRSLLKSIAKYEFRVNFLAGKWPIASLSFLGAFAAAMDGASSQFSEMTTAVVALLESSTDLGRLQPMVVSQPTSVVPLLILVVPYLPDVVSTRLASSLSGVNHCQPLRRHESNLGLGIFFWACLKGYLQNQTDFI